MQKSSSENSSSGGWPWLSPASKAPFAQHALPRALFPLLGEEDFERTRSWNEGIAPMLDSRIHPIDYPRLAGYRRSPRGKQRRPIIRSITHAPDQTGSQ